MKVPKIIVKTFAAIVSFLIIIISSYIIYCWATYIDKTITEGNAFGFTIGETKLEVFQNASLLYHDKAVYILHPLDKNDFGPHKKITFRREKYELLQDRDIWGLYFDEGFFNTLRLFFHNGKLYKIYRHRKIFELP